MRLEPLLHVVLAAGRDESPAVNLGEVLQIAEPAIGRPLRQAREDDFDVTLDHRCNGLVGFFRRGIVSRFVAQLVEPVLSLLAALFALGKFDLLAVDPRHPPAGLPVEPRFRDTCHVTLPF